MSQVRIHDILARCRENALYNAKEYGQTWDESTVPQDFIQSLIDKHWRNAEIVNFLSYMEDYNPWIEEDDALAKMQNIEFWVNKRLELHGS